MHGSMENAKTFFLAVVVSIHLFFYTSMHQQIVEQFVSVYPLIITN